MSMILRIEYDVASCKDCPLLGRDGVNYTCRLICGKYLDFLTFDQKRDEECPLVNVESREVFTREELTLQKQRAKCLLTHVGKQCERIIKRLDDIEIFVADMKGKE